MTASSDPDFDVELMGRVEAKQALKDLRNVVRTFLRKEGQELCWDNYNDLGQALPEKLVPRPCPDDPLDMMAGCVAYCRMVCDAKRRLGGGDGNAEPVV